MAADTAGLAKSGSGCTHKPSPAHLRRVVTEEWNRDNDKNMLYRRGLKTNSETISGPHVFASCPYLDCHGPRTSRKIIPGRCFMSTCPYLHCHGLRTSTKMIPSRHVFTSCHYLYHHGLTNSRKMIPGRCAFGWCPYLHCHGLRTSRKMTPNHHVFASCSYLHPHGLRTSRKMTPDHHVFASCPSVLPLPSSSSPAQQGHTHVKLFRRLTMQTTCHNWTLCHNNRTIVNSQHSKFCTATAKYTNYKETSWYLRL